MPTFPVSLEVLLTVKVSEVIFLVAVMFPVELIFPELVVLMFPDTSNALVSEKGFPIPTFPVSLDVLLTVKVTEVIFLVAVMSPAAVIFP